MDFNGRHVVITGASTGIGRASAARVAALGGRVTLIARRADDVRVGRGERANQLGHSLRVFVPAAAREQ